MRVHSPLSSSVHGISQARILQWLSFPSPGVFPDPGIEPGSPTLQVDLLPLCHLRSLKVMVGDKFSRRQIQHHCCVILHKNGSFVSVPQIGSELQYSQGGDKYCQNLLWFFCVLVIGQPLYCFLQNTSSGRNIRGFSPCWQWHKDRFLYNNLSLSPSWSLFLKSQPFSPFPSTTSLHIVLKKANKL